MPPELLSALMTVLRWAINAGLMWLAGRGLLSASDAGTLADALVQIAPYAGSGLVLAWGIYSRRKAAAIARVAAMPEVHQVVTTPAVAAAQPSDKVVPVGAA